jgi:two-component system, chemotaxis family, sensor kinase CheA
MTDNSRPAGELLDDIASIIPLVDSSDLSSLADILSKLEILSQIEDIPKALRTTAIRGIELSKNIIMDETPFVSGCKKLETCITKMQNGLKAVNYNQNATTPSASVGSYKENMADDLPDASVETDNAEKSNEGAFIKIADDLKDLLMKFASQQQTVLEDFEAYILEFEKGNPDAKNALKRILHTWKGEFGVLDLSDYSKLIHEIENSFENGAVTAEHLFKLKDFLLNRFSIAQKGLMPVLPDSEKKQLVPESPALPDDKVVKSVKPDKTCTLDNTSKKSSEAPATEVQQPAIINADPSLVTDFIHEAHEHIHAAETFLLELETDPVNAENINSVFRAWHTIKGVAGFLGLKEIGSLAHGMENLMDLARKHELMLNAEYIDILLEGNDCLKEFIEIIEKSLSGEPFRIPDNYNKIISKLKSPSVQKKSEDLFIPPAEKKIGELLVEKGVAAQNDVAKALQLQKDGDTRKIGEILITEQNIPARNVASALANQTVARQNVQVDETIRVPVNRIDQLVDSIGEAVIAQSMINASPTIKSIEDQSLHTKIAHSEMILHQIQELAMSLRMVSIKSTFQKMARLVRDLSKKSGKEVNFVTEGEDTELDKSVVEKIGDPLIHMIRNAVDHGIEAQEDRKKNDKSAVASVILKAYHKAGSIYIEVRDDGKGLDKDAIMAKAVSKELCKPDAVLSDQEIFAFIFLPGFSTAKVVTDVSGRGVGMDVVKRNIEALRGTVEIQSEKNIGTAFIIRLPLTLAIVDGMIIRAAGESYIVPTLSIVESLIPADDQRKTVFDKGKMINVRGELIPLVSLVDIFDKQNNADYCKETVIMIVEDMLGKKIGLQINEILGQQQVVIKNLGDGIGDVPGISGGAIMTDGHVSLILDIDGISRMVEGKSGSSSCTKPESK